MDPIWPELRFAGYTRGMGKNLAPFDWHAHPCAELVLVPRGHCRTLFEKNRELDCPRWTLLITPPDLAHRQVDTPKCDTLFLGFESGGIEFDTSLRTFDTKGDLELIRWFYSCYRLFRRGEVTGAAGALVGAALLRIRSLEEKQERMRYLHPSVKAAVGFIAANLEQKLALSEIARHSGISASRLNVLFRAQFHCSVGEYLAERRMSLARTLLCNPMFTVADVAAHVGFSDVNYFIRCFGRRCRQTPGQFRNSGAQTKY